MRLADAHILAGGLLPVLREGDVDVFVELARRIVGGIEQRDLARWPFAAGAQQQRGARAPARAAQILPFVIAGSTEQVRRLRSSPAADSTRLRCDQRAGKRRRVLAQFGNRGRLPVPRAQPRAEVVQPIYRHAVARDRPAVSRRRRCPATAASGRMVPLDSSDCTSGSATRVGAALGAGAVDDPVHEPGAGARGAARSPDDFDGIVEFVQLLRAGPRARRVRRSAPAIARRPAVPPARGGDSLPTTSATCRRNRARCA